MNILIANSPARLEELIKTHRLKFANLVKKHENQAIATEQLELVEQKLGELEDKINANQINRIKELEIKNQSSWKSIRQELNNVNSQRYTAVKRRCLR